MIYFKKNGFTLIELLIVIVIISISIVLVAPNLSSIFNKNKAIEQSHNFLSALVLARSEADISADNISICAKEPDSDLCIDYTTSTNNNTWENGWLLFQDANNNGTYEAISEKLIRIQIYNNNTVTSSTPASTVTLNQNGNVTRGSGQYKLIPKNCSGNGAHLIIVSSSGAITVQATTCD